MGASLPLIALGLLAFLFHRRGDDLRVASLSAALVWGVLIALSTEALSLGHWLTYRSVVITWISVDVLLALGCLWSISHGHLTKQSRPRLSLSPFERMTVGSILFIVAMLGTIAIVAAPNNWDSMTYHLGRVMHWIQNRSTDFYPTSILRQLYMKPWAEYAILHFQLLSGGDRFANLGQWLAMVGSISGVTLIAKELGANRTGQIFAAAVCATIPMGIMESSSTQNDYVVAFWMVCLVYYVVSIAGNGSVVSRPSLSSAVTEQRQHADGALASVGRRSLHPLQVGASVGLAFLTKGTAYIYSVPFLAWYAAMGLRRRGWLVWQPWVIVGGIVLVLNIGHEIRNVQVFGRPLASGDDPIANAWFTPQAFFSNAVRNLALHTGIGRFESTVRGMHEMLGIDVNDPRTTVDEFAIPKLLDLYQVLHEDYAGNPLHLVLILAATGALLLRRSGRANRTVLSYVVALISAFVLFCVLLRWAPHHSRIQLSMFVLSSPLAGLVLSRMSRFKAHAIISILIVGSLPWVFLNRNRPLLFEVLRVKGFVLKSDFTNIFNTDRTTQMFRNRPELKDAYVGAASLLAARNCDRIGLSIGSDDWEYPLWKLLHIGSGSSYRVEHVDLKNVSRKKEDLSFVPCAVVYMENPAGPKEVPNQWVTHGMRYEKQWSMAPIHVYVLDSR